MLSPNAPTRSDTITIQLRVHLLGPFQAFLDDQLITGFESNKVRAMLAYLAVEARQAQPRERLADLLWPDWPQKSAMDNLRYALADMRKNLRDREVEPPFLLISREAIQLNPAGNYVVDVAEFEKHASLRDASSLQAAVELYRGAFLDGFSLGDSPGFEQWLLAKREYYSRVMLGALQRLAAHCERSGEYELGLGYALRQLALEPWLEEAHRQSMRLLVLNGQRSQALVQYEVCKQALKTGLNAEPSLETIQLYEAIRKDEFGRERPREAEAAMPVKISIAVPERPSCNLPRQLTPLIGREAEINEVQALVEEAALVTLTGSGGVGKTRLGIQAAEQMVDRFEEGVWFIELAPLSDSGLVAQRIAKVLGLVEEVGCPVDEQLLAFLRSRQMLLVLDNCEHLIEACAHLADDLLRGCPRLKLLATSREALGVGGERVYHVPSLDVPDPKQTIPLEQLRQVEAVRLFTERARAVLPAYEVSEENAARVAQICRRLDGIPLAIELAAARLNLLTTEQLASRLDDAFRLLTGGSRAALPRQQTLRATIDWSYQLLSEPERILLRRLAVFSGGWVLEAAEEVCSAQGLDKDNILEPLAALVDKSVIGVERAPGEEARYRLLETVRQYAREKLFDGGEIQELRNRHLAHYISLAEQAESMMYSAQRLECQKLLNAELDNFRAAIEWSYSGKKEAEPGLRIAAAIGRRFMQTMGLGAEARGWLFSGLDLASDNPIHKLLHARVLNTLGWLAGNLAGLDYDERWYRDVVSLCRSLGPEGQAELSWALWSLSDCPDADHVSMLHQEAIDLARQLPPTTMNLWYLAFVLIGPPSFPISYENVLDSIQLHRRTGDHWSTAGALWYLGGFAQKDEKLEQSTAYYIEALRLLQEAGDRIGIIASFGHLSNHYLLRGDYEQSLAFFKECLTHYHYLAGPKRDMTFIILGAYIVFDLVRRLESINKQILLENATALMGFAHKKYFEQWITDRQKELLEGLPQLLDAEAYAKAWQRGQSMDFDEAVKLALSISI